MLGSAQQALAFGAPAANSGHLAGLLYHVTDRAVGLQQCDGDLHQCFAELHHCSAELRDCSAEFTACDDD